MLRVEAHALCAKCLDLLFRINGADKIVADTVKVLEELSSKKAGNKHKETKRPRTRQCQLES